MYEKDVNHYFFFNYKYTYCIVTFLYSNNWDKPQIIKSNYTAKYITVIQNTGTYAANQGCGSGSVWIRIPFSSGIRIQEGKI